MKKKLFAATALIFLIEIPHARSAGEGVPVRITVTAEPKQGDETPLIRQDEVAAYQGRQTANVASWIPARDANSALELFFLIDDTSGSNLGSQLSEIRQFISTQAPATLTGVAYMQNGIAQVVQNLTADHSAAAGKVRLPLGMITAGSSPYLSLSDLIKRWPGSAARHEIVMISSGVDPLGGAPPVDPYLQTAIDNAQRAGVVVFTIYTPHIGHFGHSFFRFYWGQNYLSELSETTGGEMYGFGNIPPVSFTPFFTKIANDLDNQYLATVLMSPGTKADFAPIRLITRARNAVLMSQMRAYVPLGG